MKFLILFLALGALAACSSTTPTPAPAPTSSTPPGSAGPALAADGKHFAADTHYQGECAPAGSRGGCYSFTFHPDGRAEHVLLDATQGGTYRVDGNAVIFRASSPDAPEQRLESTDGFRTIGGNYRFKP